VDRFEDLTEDFALHRALDDVGAMVESVRQASEKNRILQAALSQIGMDDFASAESADGSYGYIPLDLNQFFELMFALEKHLADDPDYRHTDKPHRPCSFLEVGCGPGRNLHILRATDRFTFDKISGFDIVPEYVAAGRKFFGLEEDIFQEDALKFDYGGYDIIYYYRPFFEDKLQEKFEKRLISTMKRGAYILASLDVTLAKSRQLVAKDSVLGIWKRL
jgi:SAM-dependent methyltransferase